MEDLQKKLKALSEPGRLRILALVMLADEVCVCKLEEALNLPQSTVSRYLGKLREAGWLNERRDGRWVYYRISDDLTDDWRKMLRQIMQQIGRDEQTEAAKQKLRQLLVTQNECK